MLCSNLLVQRRFYLKYQLNVGRHSEKEDKGNSGVGEGERKVQRLYECGRERSAKVNGNAWTVW